jgi:hypothetical protein
MAWLVPQALFDAARGSGAAAPPVPLDVLDIFDPFERGRRNGVVFLGDSIVVSYPKGRRVPERLQQLFGPRRRIQSLAAPGMAAFDLYFISELVVDLAPEAVVVPFNLASFSEEWRGTFSRPQLAGWLPASQLPRALRLPLDWIGLTADRLASYQLVVALGQGARWHELTREQARVGAALAVLRRGLGKSHKRFEYARFEHLSKVMVDGSGQRFSRAGALRRMGPALAGVAPDHPVLRALRAALARFREAGLPVLVYSTPANVEHLRTLGFESEGLARTLASLREVAEREGAHFVDRHALLPDAGFRDAAGHFATGPASPDGPMLLARSLLPPLSKLLEHGRD